MSISEQRTLQPCGTRAAYRRHKRKGEEPCGPCGEAYHADNRASGKRWSARRSAERATRVPVKHVPQVEVPTVVPGPLGVGPCAVPANGLLWDPVRDGESHSVARRRQRQAAAVCLTHCPVLDRCRINDPGVAGVVAGVIRLDKEAKHVDQ